jgi:hypothetical protein
MSAIRFTMEVEMNAEKFKELRGLIAQWRATNCRTEAQDRVYRVCADQLEPLLAALLDEVEALTADAERWRHARKLLTVDDIEGSQGAFDSFGGLVSEDECKRADSAIDAATAKKAAFIESADKPPRREEIGRHG